LRRESVSKDIGGRLLRRPQRDQPLVSVEDGVEEEDDLTGFGTAAESSAQLLPHNPQNKGKYPAASGKREMFLKGKWLRE